MTHMLKKEKRERERERERESMSTMQAVKTTPHIKHRYYFGTR
jgi:hypothetical protein